jgi:hypothetical protein
LTYEVSIFKTPIVPLLQGDYKDFYGLTLNFFPCNRGNTKPACRSRSAGRGYKYWNKQNIYEKLKTDQ